MNSTSGKRPQKLWKRKAYAPRDNVCAKRDNCLKALFVMKGPTIQLTKLWHSIKKETKNGHLGYFSSFSDDSQTLIVYIGNALNISSKKEIQNKLFDLILHNDLGVVSVYYRTNDERTLKRITDRRSDRICVPESSHESEYDYQSNDESDTQSDDESEEELSETDSSDIESDKSDSHSEDESDGDNGVVSDSDDELELIKVIKVYKKPKTLKRKKSPNKVLTRYMVKENGKRLKIHDYRR